MRTPLLSLALAASTSAAPTTASAAPAPSRPALAAGPTTTPERVDFHTWTTAPDFAAGSASGVTILPGDRAGIVIGAPSGTTTYEDPSLKTSTKYAYSTWTSPLHPLTFGATEAVSSWDAQTPAGTWLKVELKATMEDGHRTGWLDMGNWASSDADIDRTSISPSAAPYGQVETDTFVASPGHSMRAYQLRVTLYRLPDSTASPRLWQLGAFASLVPDRTGVPAGPLGGAEGTELAVPRYSQQIHVGQYDQYGGGGDAWCSPTSSEMVSEYWGMHPTASDLAWVDPSYTDPSVDYAARSTYDHAYDGTGNWPFNAAFAAHYGLDAEVVRLPGVDDLERLVSADIPVVIAVAFDNGELTGSGYGTAGHLMVVVGFTAGGDFIVNDPFSPSDPAVRHVYQRDQLENIWLRTYWTRADGSKGHGSGGVAYVYKPHDKPLPPVLDPLNPAW